MGAIKSPKMPYKPNMSEITEVQLQFFSLGKLLICCVYGFLYGLGGCEGSGGKFWRRNVAPLFLMVSLFVLNSLRWSNWGVILWVILLGASSHLGYGGTDLWEKVWKRLVWGMWVGVSALLLISKASDWYVWGVHMGLVLSGSVLFGVWNPFRSARDEETVLGFVSVLLPIFMI